MVFVCEGIRKIRFMMVMDNLGGQGSPDVQIMSRYTPKLTR